MKLFLYFILAYILVFNNLIYSQDKKASELGGIVKIENKSDSRIIGNWEVIPDLSDSTEINLMPDQDGPTGQYVILKPTNNRSLISTYIEDGYLSVELGFYLYRKKNKFYGNLDASVAVVFEEQYKGQFIEFKCKYVKSKDQLKLTTSKNVVFYLKRF